MTEPTVLRATVPDHAAGRRFDAVLAELFPEYSRSRLAAWIKSGDAKLDGRTVRPRDPVLGGETVTVEAVLETQTHDAPQEIPLQVLYEDEHLFVIDKPPGLVVHPGAGNPAGTLVNALLHRDPGLANLPRAGIVHRLDKDTSGVMVVARTPEAQTALVRDLARRAVEREYVALARGDLAREATIDAPIGRHPVQRTSMAVVERGKPARTRVRPVERYGAATLVRCRLETGRTHQIRVHLAAIGHPLVGDPVYGGRGARAGPAFGRQALHAERLAFAHPSTGATVAFVAPLPADLEALVGAMRAASKTR